MPSIVINSANIGTFQFTVSFDVYNRRVLFNTSGTTYNGSGSSSILGIYFSLEDQSGVTLASINIGSPQIAPPVSSSNWIYSLDLSSVDFSFLFQKYKIIGAIQDNNGTVYQTVEVIANLCQPQNLTDSGYVPGMFGITPDCINNILTVKELSLLVYNNLQPISVTKSGTLNYPTGTISPVAFANTPFSNNVVYTGQYNIQCTTIATYALGNDVYALISYITNNVFPVTCANKISDLMCCIVKVQDTAIRHCEDAIGDAAKQQLNDILPYVVTGIGKEINGQDASFEADYIRKFLNCNCGSASQQQSEFTPINPAVTSIVLAGVGGTTIAPPTVTGNTKTYNIKSSIYQVGKGDTGDLAFTITVDTTVPNTVKYLLTINYDVFAGSILMAIGNDPALINQLNALINVLGFNAQGLDGKCIIDLSEADYSLSAQANGSTLINNIVINGTTYAAPSNLFANNATPINVWLNSLSKGTFNAVFAGSTLTILSLNNTNIISTMTFSSPVVTVQFQSSSATLNQVLQAIFDYVCGMTALQVALGANLSLCTFDYNGAVVVTNYPSTAEQSDFNAGVSGAICNLAARINSLTGITCAKLQAIFQDNPSGSFGPSDRLYGTLNGACAGLTDQQTALMVIAAVNKYADVKTAWCAVDCSVPGTCPDVSAINMNVLSGNIAIYGVTFTSVPSANQLATVRYRVSGSMTWLIATSSLNLFPNGNVSTSPPFVIPGGTPGTTYDVNIFNNCGGLGFTTQITTPTGTIYSGSFLLDNIIYSICGDTPTTLYSNAPFGTGVTMYTDAGLTTIASGFLFIASVTTNQIFNMNSSTAVVGANTGSTCTSGTAGVFKLDNSAGTICAQSTVTLYTNGAFAVGKILYTDPALTNPQTGFSFVANTSDNHIYNLNSSTGAVISDTGSLCTGAATLTFRFVNAGGSFLNCQANLSVAIDANVNINRFFSDGFTSSICSGGAVSSAQKNTTMTIVAGGTAVGSAPDSTTGTWASAIKNSVYNIIVNGSAMTDGATLMIGSYLVTMSIPSCES